MSDWAEELAEKLCATLEDGDFAAVVPDLVLALRKAKADGMREAAQIMDDMPTLGQFLTGLETVRNRAAEIEKGNA